MKRRFGLIGGGLAGPLFAGALQTHPRDAELWAVATHHEVSARAFAARFQIPVWYDDWRALVADPQVDVVCIATPTGDHAAMAVAAAKAGKHVLTEKPIATTLTQADAMIEACEGAGVTLGVIFMYRFMDTARKMKAAIDQGMIGRPILGECIGKFLRDQPYYDSAAWRGTWAAEGGGSLMTQTSHTLDLLLWMLGDVTRVSGFYTVTPRHRIETEDLLVGTLAFHSGALGSIISSSAITPPEERVVTIHGERGTVRLVGDRLVQWDTDEEPDAEIQSMLTARPLDRGDTVAKAGYVDAELHRRQIVDFLTAIEEGRRPLVDGAEGRRTLEVMRALYLSSDRHQVMTLPVCEEEVVP